MSVESRIRWFHQKIVSRSYPNARLLSERFGISHRQAQRDVDFLRNVLKAPLAYSFANRGFYYNAPFSFPSILTDANDELSFGLTALSVPNEIKEETATVQLQIPYSAVITCPNKLALVEFRNMVVEESGRDRYRVEFHSVEVFLGLILTANADIGIETPAWLRERLVDAAKRILKNNLPLQEPTDEAPILE